MNSRLKSIVYIFNFSGILICISLFALHVPTVFAQDPVPTPTYDPFAQPELPPNPTGLEMGRYLFWRHCMPCHGDVGQGLTDDFRMLWEDHANCWESGCHSGKKDDEGFQIPKIIPAIVTEDHLNQFTSEEELFEFLKATHPPQHPGYLENREYHDIALILFNMNSRNLDENIASPTPSPSPTNTLEAKFTSTPAITQSGENAQSKAPIIMVGLGIVFLAIVFGILQKFRRRRN